jgi:hypothetical protein
MNRNFAIVNNFEKNQFDKTLKESTPIFDLRDLYSFVEVYGTKNIKTYDNFEQYFDKANVLINCVFPLIFKDINDF